MRRNEGRGAMNLQDAALYTGVSERSLSRAIHATETVDGVPPLPARKLGRRYLVMREDLDKWLASLPEA